MNCVINTSGGIEVDRLRYGFDSAGEVPLPVAVWLLGTAFPGSIGISRRKRLVEQFTPKSRTLARIPRSAGI